jgi:hypothetical protein
MIRPDTDELIAFLNSLVELDRYAVAELLTVHVPCNKALAGHPSVQVCQSGEMTYIAPGTFRVGFLGILNGYCGIVGHGERADWGPITAVYENRLLVRFERTKEAEC